MNYVPDDISHAILERIVASRQALIDLCLKLGNMTDLPGYERPVGDAVAAWLRQSGIPVRVQTISDQSINVVGLIRGSGDRAGGGRSLILNAHMDTQGREPVGDEALRRRVRGAWVENDMLYGRSLANDKAQLAAELIAARAIQ